MTARRTSALLAVLALSVPIAACGGDDEEGQGIPQDAAAQLQRQLDSIESRFEEGGGACADITEGDDTNLQAVGQTIESLPDDVDADVRDSLTRSFERLFQLVEQECEPEEPESTETQPTETVPPPETETQPTETAPEREREKEEKKEEKEQRQENGPGEGDGGGQGGNDGDGGGGGAVAPNEG